MADLRPNWSQHQLSNWQQVKILASGGCSHQCSDQHHGFYAYWTHQKGWLVRFGLLSFPTFHKQPIFQVWIKVAAQNNSCFCASLLTRLILTASRRLPGFIWYHQARAVGPNPTSPLLISCKTQPEHSYLAVAAEKSFSILGAAQAGSSFQLETNFTDKAARW